jgi:CDP-glucose 4,6-dehydratase
VEGLGVSDSALPDPKFWAGKRVLLTGHTGFTGSWTALWLASMGAKVSGFALEPDTEPSLYRLAAVDRDVAPTIGDLRDARAVREAVEAARPELVIHLAAQAIVRRGIARPAETFAVNVQGTAHVLDALREISGVRAVLVVTSDKVYANDELGRPFKETDRLGGKDPYSASKAAAELLTRSYGDSFFEPSGVAIATARAGNIIGGGDFAPDRLVPDLVRALRDDKRLELRHPEATRPWQHVLDCICGYLLFVERLSASHTVPHALNFGPDSAPVTVAQLADALFTAFGRHSAWSHTPDSTSIEMRALAVDPSQARMQLRWRTRLMGERCVRWTAGWYRASLAGEDMRAITLRQISDYMDGKAGPE